MDPNLIFVFLHICLNSVLSKFQLDRSYHILHHIQQVLFQRVRDFFHSTPKFAINCKEVANKYVVITDGDSQYGRDLAKLMVENGAKVIVGFRQPNTLDWLRELKKKLKYDDYLKAVGLNMDYCLSITEFAANVMKKTNRIDVLICNACVMSNTSDRQLAVDSNFELHFYANHLGNLLLIQRLFEALKESRNARIVIESSPSHRFGEINFDDINLENDYTTTKAYFQSKLANILFARHFARLSSVIHTYSVNPGYIAIQNELDWSYDNNAFSYFERSVYMLYSIVCRITGAPTDTTLYCALDASIANESGCYYSNLRRFEQNDSIVNDDLAERLWNLSCDLLQIDRHFLNRPLETDV